jgi:hypothetical protein
MGGGIQTVNTTRWAGPAASHTSHLNLNVDYKVSDMTGFFITIIFLTGEDNKAVFLFLVKQEGQKKDRLFCSSSKVLILFPHALNIHLSCIVFFLVGGLRIILY